MSRILGLGMAIILVLSITGTSCTIVPANTPASIETSKIPYSDMVQEFIKKDATYAFDGIEGSVRYITSEPGWTSAFRSTAFTFEYQTRHPGHGDRTGKILSQVITNHTAIILVNLEKEIVATAICDKEWDMVNDKNPPVSVTGIIIGGGDITPPGLMDAPRTFIYQVKKKDGTIVNVQYTAYPPSPIGDANRAKITLEFHGGSILIGDKIEAYGRLDKETGSVTVADQGDYIKTYASAPYKTVSVNVSWDIGDTMVAATITEPEEPGLYPGIVFVPGSGPTDRDWNSPLLPGTNGSARLLAEEFARQGFVTIRYDKRFTGPNAAKNIPLMIGKTDMAGHVAEIEGAVAQLAVRNVDIKQIYLVANSEGNIHSINYQLSKEPKFAGMILIAPPGRNMTEVMHSQLEAQLMTLPNGKDMMTAFDQMMADFLAGKPFQANPVLPEALNQLIQSLYAPMNLPFTRELFQVDLRTSIAKVSVPTLVVIGKKDIQVDYKLDGAPLEQAVKDNNNFKFVYPENANHVLKYEAKPREDLTAADGLNYNAADAILDQDAVNMILAWAQALIYDCSQQNQHEG